MTTNTIDLKFGDGSYTFALPVPRIVELQEKTKTGIGALHARVMKGAVIADKKTGEIALLPNFAEFYLTDLIETIRQALMGGGKGMVDGQEVTVTPQIVARLMEAYVVAADGTLRCPLHDLWNIAYAILGVCVCGFNPPKKDQPAKARAAGKPRKKAGSTTA